MADGEAAPPGRSARGRYQPGVSGNPAGRPPRRRAVDWRRIDPVTRALADELVQRVGDPDAALADRQAALQQLAALRDALPVHPQGQAGDGDVARLTDAELLDLVISEGIGPVAEQ